MLLNIVFKCYILGVFFKYFNLFTIKEITVIKRNKSIHIAIAMQLEQLTEEQVIRFVCDCALINIELLEQHSRDYDSIKNFLENASSWSQNRCSADAYRVMRMLDGIRYPKDLLDADVMYKAVTAARAVKYAVHVAYKYQIPQSIDATISNARYAGATQEQIKALLVSVCK